MRITNGPQGYKIDGIYIDEIIFNNELYDYEIRDREDLIDDLIQWISECKNSNKQLMKDGLKLLINMEGDYILSSLSTNDFISSEDTDYNLHCDNILKLNKSIG